MTRPTIQIGPATRAVLVGGVPEEADRPAEPLGEVEARRGSLAQCDEERVLEGHAASMADLCNELQ